MIRSVGGLRALRSVAWLGVAALVAVCLPAAAQPVYTWTDGNGTVHFSDSPPPPGQKYEQRGAVPLEPPVRQDAGAGTSEAQPAGAAPAAGASADQSADAEKKPARVIITSKEAVPRGPDTRHVTGAVKNVGGMPAGSVAVTITTVDQNGSECSRVEMEVVPGTLDGGDTGNFDGTVDSPCLADGGSVDAEVHWD